MYQLHIETEFSAAHNLRGYQGKCEKLHGHNYIVEVEVSGNKLDETGMLVDFKVIKNLCIEITERLDHGYLNDIEPFDRINPTTENIARHLCETIQDELPVGLRATSVTCWESGKCAARYVPEN